MAGGVTNRTYTSYTFPVTLSAATSHLARLPVAAVPIDACLGLFQVAPPPVHVPIGTALCH